MASTPALPDQASLNQTTAESTQPAQEAPSAPGNRVRISPWSITLFAVVFWVLPLLGLFFARFITILLVVFLAVLFSTFLSPVVTALQRLRIPRSVSILLIYLLIIGAIYLVGRLAVPLFIDETQRLVNDIPTYLHRFAGPLKSLGITLPSGGHGINIKSMLQGFFSNGGHSVTGIAGTALGIVVSVGALAVALLSIVVLAFFLTVRRTFTADIVNALVPPAYRLRWIHLMSRMGERMGGWVIGQIIITIYYAVVFSAGLALIHEPNPISIGVITGVLEIIPFVGGFIGVVLAVLVALTVNFTLVIWVVVLYLIVTNVEAHILVPLIYGRTVHLHPALVIVSLLFGAEAFGLLGAIIAVPIAAALQVAVENLYVKDVVVAAEQQQAAANRRLPNFDLSRWRHPRHHQHNPPG